MKKLIAYCGLDCEKCDAYLATINDDQELRIKTAKLWAELNHAPILATVYKGNIIKINNGLPILRRDTAQTRLRAVFL